MTTDEVLLHLWQVADMFREDYLSDLLEDGGRTYYNGERPIATNQSSFKEDVVIAVPTGTSGDVQRGTCIVNVFVNDIIGANTGTYLQDRRRCVKIGDVLERHFITCANEHESVERGSNIFYSKGSGDMIVTLNEETTHQHFVSLKFDFKVYNKNY